MQTIVQILAGLALVTVVPILWRGRAALRHTTLTTAWNWAAAALVLWAAAWCLTLTGTVERGPSDQIWYAASVAMLCPAIAVLGARRPGARVWGWFVLLPLLLVLGLPALTAWEPDFTVRPLELETPVVLGYLLVLMMGAGNYFGTRHTPSALLVAAALVLTVAPFSPTLRPAFPEADVSRAWGTICLSLAALAAVRPAARDRATLSGLDRLWIDFRDTFGIVWARRVQDRINRTADEEQWPARLQMHGLVWTRTDLDAETRSKTTARAEHTLRWLLKRFVDPEWIDERLAEHSEPRRHGDTE